MKANYHTHTWRCNHATGTEEDYVKNALARGLHTLGFSDHTPYFFPGDYYSHFRMRPEQLRDYTDCIEKLKQRFSGAITLYTGLEAEYYPAYFDELKAFLQDYPLDYLILGQHFVGNEPYGQYSGQPTADADVLKSYCRQVMEAMQTGLFSYIAHPDIIHFVGDPNTYRANMRDVVQEAMRCRMPLEINLLGLVEGKQYPSRTFLELAAEENCPMILGIDAHEAKALTDLEPEQTALATAVEFGIQITENLMLNPVR